MRLVYLGHAAPLPARCRPATRQWIDTACPRRCIRPSTRAPVAGRRRFPMELPTAPIGPRRAGRSSSPLLASTSNPERPQMATLIQDDLGSVGMRVECRAAGIPQPARPGPTYSRLRGLHPRRHGQPRCRPEPDLALWLSSGGNISGTPQKTPATPWEAEIDRLMRQPDRDPQLHRAQAPV